MSDSWQQVVKAVWEKHSPNEMAFLERIKRRLPTIKLPEPDPNAVYCFWNSEGDLFPIRCPRHGIIHRGNRMTVSPFKFGKDHNSTMTYIESRCVDHCGVPDRSHMRTDKNRHPRVNKTGRDPHLHNDKKYPTILAGGEQLPNHDDWDCAEDLAAAGLLTIIKGEGAEKDWVAYELTDQGWAYAGLLRKALAINARSDITGAKARVVWLTERSFFLDTASGVGEEV